MGFDPSETLPSTPLLAAPREGSDEIHVYQIGPQTRIGMMLIDPVILKSFLEAPIYVVCMNEDGVTCVAAVLSRAPELCEFQPFLAPSYLLERPLIRFLYTVRFTVTPVLSAISYIAPTTLSTSLVLIGMRCPPSHSTNVVVPSSQYSLSSF
jgi:hypothetical protein